MEENKTIVSEDQQPDNVTSTEKEGQKERLFTQDELNKIIAERLARERDKISSMNTEELDRRSKDLEEREALLASQAKQLDDRETQLSEREAAVRDSEARGEKLRYLTETLHVKPDAALTLVETVGGETVGAFKDNVKILLSAADPADFSDLDGTVRVGSKDADTLLRDAFGLQRS